MQTVRYEKIGNIGIATISRPEALNALNSTVIADLNACGGIHCVAVAFNVIGIKHIRVNNAIPALIFVVPLTILWALVGL